MNNHIRHTYQLGISFFGTMVLFIILAGTIGGWFAFNHFKKLYRVKHVVAELTEYSTAAKSFRDIYEYLPGDMPNATTFWSDPATCPGVAWAAGGCNGNGNNQVNWGTSDSNESLRAWQHLALSGLIDGRYTGLGAGADGDALPGANVPASVASGVGFDFHYGAVGPIKERNYIGVGGYNTGGPLQSPALTPSEAYNIDVKLDDGYPLQGNFVSSNGIGAADCTRGFVEASSTYNSTNSSVQCISHFSIDKDTSR